MSSRSSGSVDARRDASSSASGNADSLWGTLKPALRRPVQNARSCTVLSASARALPDTMTRPASRRADTPGRATPTRRSVRILMPRSFHGDYDLAAGMPFFQVAKRLGRLTQPVGLVDDRRDSPGFHEPSKRREVVFVELCQDHAEFLAGKWRQQPRFGWLYQPAEPAARVGRADHDVDPVR